MKAFAYSLLLSLSLGGLAQAEQLELPFEKQPDEILREAYPGEDNTEEITYEAMPEAIQKAFAETDLSFELGDGYYDYLASAYFTVKNQKGEVVGYMEAGLMSYTEDPDVTLAAVLINAHGIRIEAEPVILNTYRDQDDPEILLLPPSLQPDQGADESED